MSLPIEEDSAHHRYVDVPTGDGTSHVRVTFIPASEAGFGENSVRIQIRDENGHLRQGPEVPLSSLGGMIDAIVRIMTERM